MEKKRTNAWLLLLAAEQHLMKHAVLASVFLCCKEGICENFTKTAIEVNYWTDHAVILSTLNWKLSSIDINLNVFV